MTRREGLTIRQRRQLWEIGQAGGHIRVPSWDGFALQTCRVLEGRDLVTFRAGGPSNACFIVALTGEGELRLKRMKNPFLS